MVNKNVKSHILSTFLSSSSMFILIVFALVTMKVQATTINSFEFTIDMTFNAAEPDDDNPPPPPPLPDFELDPDIESDIEEEILIFLEQLNQYVWDLFDELPPEDIPEIIEPEEDYPIRQYIIEPIDIDVMRQALKLGTLNIKSSETLAFELNQDNGKSFFEAALISRPTYLYFNDGSEDIILAEITNSVASVSEPNTFILLFLGISGMAYLSRKRLMQQEQAG